MNSGGEHSIDMQPEGCLGIDFLLKITCMCIYTLTFNGDWLLRVQK